MFCIFALQVLVQEFDQRDRKFTDGPLTLLMGGGKICVKVRAEVGTETQVLLSQFVKKMDASGDSADAYDFEPRQQYGAQARFGGENNDK